MNKILILGGTNFIGRNLIDELIKLDNFNITLFNRGHSNTDLYPELRKIQGDRNTSDINQIFKENWDYIVDLSCYFPESLRQIISNLDKSFKRYIFISTSSVYDNIVEKSILRNEKSPILDCNYKESLDTSLETYGKRKAECERILTQSNLKYTILRPALVYGVYDNTDRFYYWLYQIKKEHKLLLPNYGKNLFSVTYVKDLIQVIIKSLYKENGNNIYNVTTYPSLSISELIDIASQLLNKQPKIYNCGTEFLNDNNISEWKDLPLWLDCDYYTYDNTKVLRDLKLKITEFKDSVSKTIEYYDRLDWKVPKFGISEKTKNELIEKITTANNV
jgi:2'-hydroxyisoflavone reductase